MEGTMPTFEEFMKDIYVVDSSLLRIDRDRLDEECIIQPELVDHFGKLHAQARDSAEALKKTISHLEANLYKGARDKAAAEGVKITEEGIKQEIRRSEILQAEEKQLRIAELRATIAWNNFQSMQSRDRAINNLVKLYLAGYFGQKEGSAIRETRINSIEQRLAEIISKEPLVPGEKIGG